MSKLLVTVFQKVCRKNLRISSWTIRNYATEQPKEQSNEYPYKFEPITKEHHDEILKLMWESFYKEEPITRGLGLGNKPNKYVDMMTMETLSYDMSIMAVNKSTGKIVGCSLNGINHPDCAELLLETTKIIPDLPTKRLYELNAFIFALSQLHERFCVQEIGEIAYVTVHKSARKKGLAFKLMKVSNELLHDKGFKMVRVDCSAIGTAKVCQKLNMKHVYELPYCAYVDECQKPIIKVIEPDVSCNTYIHICE